MKTCLAVAFVALIVAAAEWTVAAQNPQQAPQPLKTEKIKDDLYESTPAGWASHFGNEALAAYLS